MAEQDDGQKTERPTAKRLSEAREQGQIPVSAEVKNWFVIAAGLAAIVAFAPSSAADLTRHLRIFLESPDAIATDPGGLGGALMGAFLHAGMAVALPLGLLFLAAFAGTALQTGFVISTEPLKPDLSKLNPLKGIGRIVSVRGAVELLKSLIKLAVIAAVAVSLMRPVVPVLDRFASMAPGDMVHALRILIMRLVGGILLVLTVVAVLDFAYQRYDFMQRMRMSKQEVKDEYKQSEGDPAVKARLRRLRVEKARRRMMANVPKADVVVTNPTHFAVAMQYDPETMPAPKVVAKGTDLVALRIRELAAEHRVTIVENPPLARALYKAVEIDQQIPPEHYKAVAQIISYVFQLRKKTLPA